SPPRGEGGERGVCSKCSLRGAGVGCPEHAQVGPLPRLSKSRRSGHLVGLADSGVPFSECWATRTCPPPFGSRSNATTPVSWAAPRECEALRAVSGRQHRVRRA